MLQGNTQTMSSHFLTRLRARCRANGFTLIELMITIAIAAILLMLAVPSFNRLILSNKLTTTAAAMADRLNAARLSAIKLNAQTQFCGSTGNGGDTLGAACTPAGAVFALPQSAGTAGSATQVQAPPPGITGAIQVAGDVTAVRFSGQGFGYAPGSPGTPINNNNIMTICTARLAADNQRVVGMVGGSIVAVATSTGSCP